MLGITLIVVKSYHLSWPQKSDIKYDISEVFDADNISCVLYSTLDNGLFSLLIGK